MTEKFTLDKKVLKSCKYEFSKEELEKISADMAEAEIKSNDLKNHLKDVTAQIKSDIQTAESSRSSAAHRIRSGYEIRDIECDQVVYPKEKKVLFLRNDTGESVGERPATAEDLQQTMFTGNEDDNE